MKIFGLSIERKKPEETKSIVVPSNDDGSTVVVGAAPGGASGYYAQVLEMDGRIKDENDLIRRYREIAAYPDCESAIDDIINEAISSDTDEELVKLDMDKLQVPSSIKKKINAEFENVLTLFKFNENLLKLIF